MIKQKDYEKQENYNDKSQEERKIELIINILKTKKELEEATKNFEYAEDELIDYYTYQIKANKSKLDYLLKQAKIKKIVLDVIDTTKLKYDNAI